MNNSIIVMGVMVVVMIVLGLCRMWCRDCLSRMVVLLMMVVVMVGVFI